MTWQNLEGEARFLQRETNISGSTIPRIAAQYLVTINFRTGKKKNLRVKCFYSAQLKKRITESDKFSQTCLIIGMSRDQSTGEVRVQLDRFRTRTGTNTNIIIAIS